MTHYTDDELVLHYYGDADAPPNAAAHLIVCGSCRDRFEDLSDALQMVAFPAAPDPGDRYGVELWHRLEPRLQTRQPLWAAPWFRPLSLAAAALVLLVAGFYAGRLSPNAPAQQAAVEPIDAAETRRVLLLSVADHLERSDRVLTDIMNASVDGDISSEQQWAADLIADNRFFRQDAADNNEASVAAVLDELERALLDIVHGPSTASEQDLEEIHRRLDSAALLFKVRVLSGELRQRELAPDSAPQSKPSPSRII